MDLVARLRRRFPALDAGDAEQYLAEARCELGPAVSEAALLRAARARARADGYGDPLVVLDDRDDGEGHVRAWLDAVSDGGAGAAAVFARLGAAGEARRRAPPRPSRLRRAVTRLLAGATLAEWTVVWARWGRLVAGLPPETLRRAARRAACSLGTAWNIEARAKRRIRALAEDREAPPVQLEFGWRAPDRPAAPPDPAGQAEPSREPERQLGLPW